MSGDGDVDDEGGREDPIDDQPSGPRPDPGDRPWVHPAELQSFVAAPQATPEPPRPREWVIGVASAVAGVAATLLLLIAFGALGDRDRSAIPPAVVTVPESPIDYGVARRVAETVAPSVVTVSIDQPSPTGDGAQGSGVVWGTDRVLTSEHLTRGAAQVTVSTKDGRTITATVLGADPSTDLALLEVEGLGSDLPELLRYDEPAVGDPVVAVASGKGNTAWVAMSVIQERNWLVANGDVTMAGLLVTGTQTRPEQTGGGLFDDEGRLLGVITSPPGSSRTGLAVPVDVALVTARQIDAGQPATHGWLGIRFDPDVRGGDGGAKIAEVLADGPAAVAQPPLQAGDVVVRAGNADVNGWHDLLGEARRRSPRDKIEIVFERNGRPDRTVVELGVAEIPVVSEVGNIG